MDGSIASAKRFSLPDGNLEPALEVACPWPNFRQNPSSAARFGKPTNPQFEING
jgi:hypothetical protein